MPGVVGRVAVAATYSRVGAKHRLAAWVRFLALNGNTTESPFDAVTVGRARSEAWRKTVTVSRFSLLAGADVRGHLHDLVSLYDEGMRLPLPLYCASSAAYAAADAAGRNGFVAAEHEWASGRFDGEGRDPEHVLVLGGEVPFDDLDGSFKRNAQRLWDGPLAVEQVEDR